MPPLRIALLGYGRMGKEVEKIALGRGHRIVARIDGENHWKDSEKPLKEADIAIDFSIPAAAVANINRCFDLHLPVVCGTTGWQQDLPDVRTRCENERQTLFVASNFSIGVHIFFATARFLAQRMNHQPGYAARIEEIHHIHKLDKPSGTAISLAKSILNQIDRYKAFQPETENGTLPSDTIPVRSQREGEVVGTHRLVFTSETDTVELTHRAESRSGLAIGAVNAAEWLKGKTGFFGMEDMLGF